jgi:hypothetical protein
VPIYAFRCLRCGALIDEFRRFGETEPPEHCGEPARRRFVLQKAINRPKGYHLRPGDKGYWDFGDLNDPNFEPPERVDEEWRFRHAEGKADWERQYGGAPADIGAFDDRTSPDEVH